MVSVAPYGDPSVHRALRDLLGEHAASPILVTTIACAFDFVHFDALTPEEMARLDSQQKDH